MKIKRNKSILEKGYKCYCCKCPVLKNAFGFWCQQCQRYYNQALFKNKLKKFIGEKD